MMQTVSFNIRLVKAVAILLAFSGIYGITSNLYTLHVKFMKQKHCTVLCFTCYGGVE